MPDHTPDPENLEVGTEEDFLRIYREWTGGLHPDGSYVGTQGRDLPKIGFVDPQNPREVIGRLLERFNANQGFRLACSYPCSTPCTKTDIVESHSLQQKGALAFIAENGKVITFERQNSSWETLQRESVAKLRGVGEVGIFKSLCSKHDDALFKRIEKTANLENPEDDQSFLFSYRAALWRRFEMRRTLLIMGRAAHFVSELSGGEVIKTDHDDFGKQIRDSSVLTMYEIEQRKLGLDRIFMHEEPDTNLFKLAFRVGLPAPFAVCDMFNLVTDLSGTPLLTEEEYIEYPFTWMFLNVIPDLHGTLVVMAFPRIRLSKMKPFVKQVYAFQNQSQSNIRALQFFWEIALRCAENMALCPSSWENLSAKKQNEILACRKQIGFRRAAANVHVSELMNASLENFQRIRKARTRMGT